MLDKINKIWFGWLFGILFPAFCFFCYWLFVHSQLNFPSGFIRYLRMGDMLQETTILCVISNLIIFYTMLNKQAYNLARGMIYATIMYVGLVFYISLL